MEARVLRGNCQNVGDPHGFWSDKAIGFGPLAATPVEATCCGLLCGEKSHSPAREKWEGQLGTLVVEVSSVKNGVIDRKQTDSCPGIVFWELGGWRD